MIATRPMPFRSISRLVRRGRRALYINRVCRSLPTAVRDPMPGDGHVTIAGVLQAPTGIGEGARLQARALDALGYSVGLVDVTRQRRAAEILALPEGPGTTLGDAGGPLVVHLNPPNMLYTLREIVGSLRNRRIIANWVWEAPVMPWEWHRALAFLHEVWVPSRFVGAAVATAGIDLPIRVVPYAVRAPERVEAMSILPGKTLYLTMFSYDSGFARKNPLGAIRAFRQAFGDRDDVHLLVKAQGSAHKHPAARDALGAAVGPSSNVSIFDRDLTTAERDALIGRADVLVSLHRSEGFGLTIAEAMLLGKAAVATNWSGNTDFMTPGACSLIDYKLVPLTDEHAAYAGLKTQWAEPDLEHAAAEMRRLADADVRQALGFAAQAAARDYFHPTSFAAAVGPAIGPARMPR